MDTQGHGYPAQNLKKSYVSNTQSQTIGNNPLPEISPKIGEYSSDETWVNPTPPAESFFEKTDYEIAMEKAVENFKLDAPIDDLHALALKIMK